MHKSGVEMKSFRGSSRILINGKITAAAAEELAAWLKLRPFCGLPPKPETVTGKDWEKKIAGRTGIIFFKDYWQRDGESEGNRSGDHIDLWNGSRLTASGLRGALTTFARFSIGISHISHVYSDLSESRQILFWEVK
ncbi:T6SS effector amidase Tae4 family protein [Geobacter sp.]|uniref:T6SS effector amidase Tae4 family protein n=1 Tax=Geobacter sp. TaxID=46610 RepID=UPI00260C9A36|nr:T6SS effector amidase Tae4 family protein [Geobacter sp.]